MRMPSAEVWLEETYSKPDGQEDVKTWKFHSKRELLKMMEKKGGFSSICLYDLKKRDEFTGEVYGQIRTLKILGQEPKKIIPTEASNDGTGATESV